MDESNNKEFELRRREKEKWERHIFLIKLYEQGVDMEEIARIAGLSEEEMDEVFPRLY